MKSTCVVELILQNLSDLNLLNQEAYFLSANPVSSRAILVFSEINDQEAISMLNKWNIQKDTIVESFEWWVWKSQNCCGCHWIGFNFLLDFSDLWNMEATEIQFTDALDGTGEHFIHELWSNFLV